MDFFAWLGRIISELWQYSVKANLGMILIMTSLLGAKLL